MFRHLCRVSGTHNAFIREMEFGVRTLTSDGAGINISPPGLNIEKSGPVALTIPAASYPTILNAPFSGFDEASTFTSTGLTEIAISSTKR